MIPKLHFISNANTAAAHKEHIQKACSSGIEAVQLDLQHISKGERLPLAQEIHNITSHFQTRLFIKTDYKLAIQLKADGVFLDQNDASPTLVRKKLLAWQSLGAAASTLAECQDLVKKEVDYIALGPFKNSQASQKTLGINGFAAMANALETETPLLGFGGITTEDVNDILETGVAGILATDAITTDFSSIKKFHKLLDAGSSREMKHRF